VTVLTKDHLPERIVTERTIVRRAVPGDLPQIAAWPEYPGHLAGFSMRRQETPEPDGNLWWERIDAPDRCHYSVVLPKSGEIIGVHAFVRIDWSKATIDNVGVRIRPDLCGQGYGSETLAPLLRAILESGIRSLRLDVAATNQRAVRCYEKCGMWIADEFWREHKGEPIDLTDPKWIPLRKHLRFENDKCVIRFYWMEIRATPVRADGTGGY